MYYEKKVVDGVLCWRGLPNGPWVPFTLKELTDRVMDLNQKLQEIEHGS